ncbi:LAFE_0D07580g1_1 [Lachancea fermentati]|uniref:LAFE_0D07580g1_1 n=1 Tax=Lachancea fermentati TaxID=4955 RepID=A0A1G4MBN6_LACFM|nr:LAFE_0D07580g1_1 [Lachancea fermentati]
MSASLDSPDPPIASASASFCASSEQSPRGSPGPSVASPVQFIKDYIDHSLNTPPGLPIGAIVQHYKRQRLVEEILESETEYLHALALLQHGFLDVLATNDYVPMRMLSSVVARIRARHAAFAAQLAQLVNRRVRRFDDSDDSADSRWQDPALRSWDQLELCHQLAQLLALAPLPIQHYRNYLLLYRQISDMLSNMASAGHDALLFAILLKIELCLPRYCSSTLPHDYKRDFSFRAMIQRPLNRLAKYRLFLESLVTLTERPSPTDLERLGETKCLVLAREIKTSSARLHSTLLLIDDSSSEPQHDPLLVRLQTRLQFPCPEEHIPIEAMGHCYLRGCLTVVWPVAGYFTLSTTSHRHSRYFNNFSRHKRAPHLHHKQLGAFLFKSYLVLATILPSKNLGIQPIWHIKFALRLATCKLVTPPSLSSHSGLQTPHEFALKMQFECDFKIWEVLLVCHNEQEFKIWKTQLELFVDVINGPHQFSEPDFDAQSTLDTLHFSDSTTFPKQMVPWQAYDERLSEKIQRSSSIYRKGKNPTDACYTNQDVVVEIAHRKLCDDSALGTWLAKGSQFDTITRSNSSLTLARTPQRTPQRPPSHDHTRALLIPSENTNQVSFYVELAHNERRQIERYMHDVWSSAIPTTISDMPPTVPETTTIIYEPFSHTDSLKSNARSKTFPGTDSSNRTASTLRTTRWSLRRVFSRRSRHPPFEDSETGSLAQRS